VYCRDEAVAKPPHRLRGWKKHVVDDNGAKGNMRTVLQSSPLEEVTFGDGKRQPQVGTLPLDDAEGVLKSADIRTYRVQANCDGEVVDIRNCQTLRDSRVEASYIKHKKKRRTRRALRGANSDRAENIRRALEYELALAFGEERLDPGKQVGGDTSLGEDNRHLICADMVRTSIDIQEKS